MTQSINSLQENIHPAKVFFNTSRDGLAGFSISPPVSTKLDIETQIQKILESASITSINPSLAAQLGFAQEESILDDSSLDSPKILSILLTMIQDPEYFLGKLIRSNYHLSNVEVKINSNHKSNQGDSVAFDVFLLSIYAVIESDHLQQIWLRINNISEYKKSLDKHESIEELRERIHSDLEMAKETQKNLVTLDFPESKYSKFTTYFRPFEKVGGDIIHYQKHENYIDILFGDVSGHGISATMVSGMVVLSFRHSSSLKDSPADLLAKLNIDLRTVVVNHHVSAACVRYYEKERKLIYSYAGHPPLVIIRDGKIIELDGMNTPLLTIENIEYFETEFSLKVGDRVVFYSDGCYEVFNPSNKYLGLYPFFELLLEENKIKDSNRYIQNCILRILNYSAGDIRDDLTMLLLDVT
ncbi:PP2C family protein-serine/threonine phosphatase [Leptospira sp. GIMC2001]|uniref:PP2C family protein-serine/threonine phosphatase n=1 Tax=Leptospira sp. GIMC2001 TaxID=1513297 RepID=UPI00234B121C|nr:PP2C family protein-serine/threonine phosphatase [Leptospira sp. GIMC2001]WCL48322.1 PP2C family protein-serine/threonine phosphatase [Leptospira sp. GIMC2001]